MRDRIRYHSLRAKQRMNGIRRVTRPKNILNSATAAKALCLFPTKPRTLTIPLEARRHHLGSIQRTVAKIINPQPVVEGAGVRLKRSIGTRTLDYLDPFLLLDHFASNDPADYEAGFPLHPHRGIETVTYMLRGGVDHRDSMGNSGSIGPGDIQWIRQGRDHARRDAPGATQRHRRVPTVGQPSPPVSR